MEGFLSRKRGGRGGGEVANRQLDLERLFKILGVTQAEAEADASKIKPKE